MLFRVCINEHRKWHPRVKFKYAIIFVKKSRKKWIGSELFYLLLKNSNVVLGAQPAEQFKCTFLIDEWTLTTTRMRRVE